ncbi:MAG: hypothetical protein J5633_05990 [Oscillospiraceae bacterium]|nr:hypothetical protein [Oscillospiraceae bacterium]
MGKAEYLAHKLLCPSVKPMHLSLVRKRALRSGAVNDIPDLNGIVLFFRAFQIKLSPLLPVAKSLLDRDCETIALLF